MAARADEQIPVACQSQCSVTIEAAYTCQVSGLSTSCSPLPPELCLPDRAPSLFLDRLVTFVDPQTQFAGDTTNIYGCFCNNYPSDADSCASCLNDNNAAALGSLLTSTKTACPQAQQQCFFQCSFDTCPAGDVNCACE
jgi:hypothetical protein